MKKGSKPDLRPIATAARAAWPDVAFDDGAFIDFLGARAARLEAASTTNAGDLLLAFACGRGDDSALRVLEREYLSRLPALLPGRSWDDATEVVQALRDRLLIPGEHREPGIVEYTGRGGMLSWLRVAAVRAALNLQRARRREVALDEDRDLAERASGDLEIDHLKKRFSTEFRAAFTEALAALSPRERNLLRQHYLDGLPMEAVGKLHRVHRVTVVRWMAGARTALARETRRALGARLDVDREELESILRLIESRMDVSLRAFLGD